MSKGNRGKKVAGLIFLTLGIGMFIGLLLPGIGFLIAAGLVSAGFYIWFL